MKVNVTPNEYRLLCEIADYYDTTPAPLAREWVMREAARQHSLIKAASGGGGILGGGGSAPPTTTATAVPATAPRAPKVP